LTKSHTSDGAHRHTPVVPEADIAVSVDGTMINAARLTGEMREKVACRADATVTE
jgi:hypothetical protein